MASTLKDPYNRLFIANPNIGDKEWEIGVIASRERLCGGMGQKTAELIFKMLCQAAELRWTHDVPYDQTLAIWRLVKEDGGLPSGGATKDIST